MPLDCGHPARRVHGDHPASRGEFIPDHLVDRDEPEFRLQAAERGVGGAVVHDDYLEHGIPQAEQPTRARDDQVRLVADRHDQADGRCERAGEYLGQSGEPHPAAVPGRLAHRQREEHQVGGVEQHEVPDAEPGDPTGRHGHDRHYRPCR